MTITTLFAFPAVLVGSLALAPPAAASLPSQSESVAVSAEGEVGPMGGCRLGFICGKVVNNSKSTMKYTTGLGAKGTSCTVWNWSGGNKVDTKKTSCGSPKSLKNGKTAGGDWSGVDVDAFTFSGSYITTWGSSAHSVSGGTWTKIESTQTANCTYHSGNKKPTCHIYTLP
ncbi:hypothetical protein ABT096_32565 [Streptomyces sp. NPDC002561]|uniref:hypothetical protein n=1 Tax=Streptomyces sp. NPDC002561 TaxID=3154418 RepID=UPI00331F7240